MSRFVLVAVVALLFGCDSGDGGAGSSSNKAKKTPISEQQNESGTPTATETKEPATQPAKEAPAKKEPARPVVTAEDIAAGEVVYKKRCSLCHKMTDADGKALGPSVEANLKVLAERLTPDAYAERIKALKVLNRNHYNTNQKAIDSILAETNDELRVRRWMDAYLRNTKFDDPKNKMTKLIPEMSSQDISRVTEWYLSKRPQ